jgi:DNA-binding MarR family transcriptional regulator
MKDRRRLADRALDVPLRRDMSAMLCAEELTSEDVAERVGRDLANTVYHLRVLEDAGLIERIGGVWRRR